ncbi:MAG TPA: hypothetical protein VIU42_06290 [Xanthobacteraceae bacterium]
MELEGNLILERRPARRWVSVAAIIIPVVACLAGVTWFVRAFISPPTIAIPSPMILAAAPPVPSVQADPPAAQAPTSAAPASPTSAPSPPPSADAASSALPMFATLAAAPPTFPSAAPGGAFAGGAPAAYADPARDAPLSNMPAAADAMIDAPPLAGPIPMPRPRPQQGLRATAALADAVPLPRTRPGEEAAAPAQQTRPAFDRHGAE